jgi:hypothetical protein
MMKTSTSKSKALEKLCTAFESLWNTGEGVLVLVDGQHPDLIMPADIRALYPLVLDYDPHALVPIDDLKIDDDGVSATLSFNRVGHKTFVPWLAILGLTNRTTPRQTSPAPKPAPKRNHLKSVPLE